jgi:hypothetical protein
LAEASPLHLGSVAPLKFLFQRPDTAAMVQTTNAEETSAHEPVSQGSRKRVSWRRRLLIISAAVIVLTGSISAAAVLGVRHGVQTEHDYWTPRYDRAITQVAHWKSESQQWQESSDQYQSQLQDLQKRIKESVGDLNNPHFVLWNSCGFGPSGGCLLRPGYEYVGGVPDTFTYYVSFRSTVPVTVKIMSSSDFVCWESGNCPARWVQWKNLTHLEGGVFHDAEGCAGYFAIFSSQQAGILYPDVSIVRNPSSHPTGACR